MTGALPVSRGEDELSVSVPGRRETADGSAGRRQRNITPASGIFWVDGVTVGRSWAPVNTHERSIY